jgi:hypothetical protein
MGDGMSHASGAVAAPSRSAPKAAALESAVAEGAGARADAAWLGVGFGLFGSVLGAIAGASSVQGISQTLLTSVLTFVGGAFLSYAGFRVRSRAGEERSVSGVRVGSSLAAISLGIWLGAAIGITARLQFDAAERARLRQEPAALSGGVVATPHGSDDRPRNLLQAEHGRSFCQETRLRLGDTDYPQTAPNVMLGELRGVIEECCGR